MQTNSATLDPTTHETKSPSESVIFLPEKDIRHYKPARGIYCPASMATIKVSKDVAPLGIIRPILPDDYFTKTEKGYKLTLNDDFNDKEFTVKIPTPIEDEKGYRVESIRKTMTQKEIYDAYEEHVKQADKATQQVMNKASSIDEKSQYEDSKDLGE